MIYHVVFENDPDQTVIVQFVIDDPDHPPIGLLGGLIEYRRKT